MCSTALSGDQNSRRFDELATCKTLAKKAGVDKPVANHPTTSRTHSCAWRTFHRGRSASFLAGWAVPKRCSRDDDETPGLVTHGTHRFVYTSVVRAHHCATASQERHQQRGGSPRHKR